MRKTYYLRNQISASSFPSLGITTKERTFLFSDTQPFTEMKLAAALSVFSQIDKLLNLAAIRPGFHGKKHHLRHPPRGEFQQGQDRPASRHPPHPFVQKNPQVQPFPYPMISMCSPCTTKQGRTARECPPAPTKIIFIFNHTCPICWFRITCYTVKINFIY